ncbi:MAG: hypothetical protein K2X11_06860 [Acetobacteraceae bacterium]|nr:hypothetical protein [Acetobacteraceae bacterium]
MTENIVTFPVPPGGRGGSGSDGGDLSSRVARLEESSIRMEKTLERLEAGQRRLEEGQTKIVTDLADLRGRVGALDGRIQGVEGRFAQIPTALQLLGFAVAVFLAAGVLRFLEPRPSAPPPTSVQQGSR